MSTDFNRNISTAILGDGRQDVCRLYGQNLDAPQRSRPDIICEARNPGKRNACLVESRLPAYSELSYGNTRCACSRRWLQQPKSGSPSVARKTSAQSHARFPTFDYSVLGPAFTSSFFCLSFFFPFVLLSPCAFGFTFVENKGVL